MRQILHGCARTTEAVHRAIQNSQESINPKTVVRWKKRDYVHDSPTGPKESSFYSS